MKKLKGINLGGWLLMEGYILGGRNIPEHFFKKSFQDIYSRKELKNFERSFRRVFITEEDIKRISSWGANCLRVPFNFRLLEEKPYQYSREGLMVLKKLIKWAKEARICVILDLHASPGAQNKDWHSDSRGNALLWRDKGCRQRTICLWQYLAEIFKKEEAIVGFDLLNEPVIERSRLNLLKGFYKRLIRKIREIDKNHFLFLEGNVWAQEIDFLEDLLEERVYPSIHFYHPLDFTFNFRPRYFYPGYVGREFWDKSTLRKMLEKYHRFAIRNKTKVFVGEFGINFRGGYFGELNWLKDCLEIFEEYDFSWTYWTYKAVASSVFPDGLIQCIENYSWIKREGPIFGWENFYSLWRREKRKILASLKSKNFIENKAIIEILKRYFLKK